MIWNEKFFEINNIDKPRIYPTNYFLKYKQLVLIIFENNFNFECSKKI